MSTIAIQVRDVPVAMANMANQTSHSPSLSTRDSPRACLIARDPLQSVIDDCNKFQGGVHGLWSVFVGNEPKPIGYMHPGFLRWMDWTGTSFDFSQVDGQKCCRLLIDRISTSSGRDMVETCRREFAKLCQGNTHDKGCKKWLGKSQARRDYHPVRGAPIHLLGLQVPSPLRGVIGMVTSGTHMNMFTVKRTGGTESVFVWVSRRSQSVTYAGKLDQVVAGGMSPEDDMDGSRTLQREAEEEAGLLFDRDSSTMRDIHGQHVGAITRGTQITFWDQKDHRAGTEEGHLEPGIRFTYDLEVAPDFVPRPAEPESIDGFYLQSVDEVKKGLRNAEWKPNCGLVMLDFLLRRGLLHEVDEESIAALRAQLHREILLDLW